MVVIDSKTKPLDVVVHPIVLLSVVDHYNRVAKGTSKRVIGTLLGEVREQKLHVLSSFAVPFEEDRDPNVWFIDHNYHEQLAAMHKKVNAKEVVVGWYSTGPKIKPADLHIHEVFRKYVPEPVFIIMEVQPKENELPMEAYYAVREKTHDTSFARTFLSLPCAFGADEAEDVGTEHLLRDIRNKSTATLSGKVEEKVRAHRALGTKLAEIKEYLEQVLAGKYPYNANIVNKLQDIFNELPEMRSAADMISYCVQESNDHSLALYVGAVLRSILGLHNLVHNKIASKKFVENEEKEAAQAKKKEEGDKKDKK